MSAPVTEPIAPDPALPRYSSNPFPRYRFVPTLNAHPCADPRGHSYEPPGTPPHRPPLLPPEQCSWFHLRLRRASTSTSACYRAALSRGIIGLHSRANSVFGSVDQPIDVLVMLRNYQSASGNAYDHERLQVRTGLE